jgi:hypothetical protein
LKEKKSGFATLDLEPVVRCGECAYQKQLDKEDQLLYGSDVLWCTRQMTYNEALVEENHFCSYGERRESNGT